jgi:hypothetical protein
MKQTLLIFLILISYFGFGQQVTAPDPKSFTVNTTGQDASGFQLSGFNSTATLLCAIGLPTAPAGTTFYMTTTAGLTASVGYTMSGNKTRLAFTGTMTNINNALASLKVNTTGTVGTIQISVSATVNPTGYFYLPTNGHFYRPMTGFTGINFSGTSPTAYDNLKNYCTQQTFKGQSGYLMTITSADEDNFVFLNVPGQNIIFALTDNVTEGRFVIDAGPETGTVVRIGTTNQTGKYNNWAGGEPNNYGSGEDYVVTKWSGGNQWNDYGPEATAFPGGVSGYVIEYGTWSNPDDQTFTDFYSNSVSYSNGETLRTLFNFNFGPNVDETIFKARLTTSTDNINFTSNNSYVALNGVGRLDLTSQIDTTKTINGYKAVITPGQVEWSLINPYDANLNGHRLQIDERVFGGVNLNTIKSVKLFDIYDGPITALDFGGWWKQWTVPGNIDLASKVAASTYQSNIRLQDGWYAFRADYTFSPNNEFKKHKLEFTDLTSTQTQSLLGSIVTVSDVYLAFKEYSDKGIMGNESRYFQNGIQFHNADVNEDGQFDERDCYLLLQHLRGATSLWNTTPSINDAMKLIPSSTYDNITKQTWNTYSNLKKSDYTFNFNPGLLNSYSLDITWKGDVNLSHSSQPTGFSTSASGAENIMVIKSMSTASSSVGDVQADIMMEKIGENIIATIDVAPNGNEIGATQFDLFFDNTILDFVKVEYKNQSSVNFGKNNGSFISVGSLNTTGGSISNIGYKITFKPKATLTNILGLISVKSNETLNTNLNKLNVKVL